MKKILSILMILVLVSGVAFAQLTPQVTASATVNWGIDLGSGSKATPQHGFENKFAAKVVVPLYMDKLNSKTEGDVHMNFDIDLNLAYRFYGAKSNSTSPYVPWKSDAELALWRKTLSGMSASVHFFGGYMNILGRPDFSTNFAKIWTAITDDGSEERPETSGDITGFGTKLGYKNDDLAGTGLKFDAGLKFGSNGSWKAKGKDAVPGKKIHKKVTFAKGYKLKADDVAKQVYKSIKKVIDGNFVWEMDEASGVKSLGGTAGHETTWVAGYEITAADAEKVFFEKDATFDGAEPAKDPAANKYAIGFDLSLGYDKWVTFDFGINATFDPIKDFGEAGVDSYDGKSPSPSNVEKAYIGTGFKLGSKPVEGLALNFGMDTLMNVGKDSKPAFDIVFDASYKWVKAGVYYGNELSNYAGKDKNGKAIGDMAAMLAFSSKDSGDTNFLEGLAFGVDFRLNHMLTAISDADKKNSKILPMGLKSWVSYKRNITDSMWIKPYTTVWAESNHTSYADGTVSSKNYFGVVYEVGTTFSPMEKVEIDAKWSHGKTEDNKYEGPGMIKTPANYKNHNGTFVIGVKVKY
ncbi:MSP porin [Treponema denticola]|uniref:major outer sheath protein Msp n=1 Tax=Treponema denticola TaxID=158 RepID=UPI0020A237D2|nr:MSP porin [Treponema denticola]UTD06208.1 MSP porin [Treponema denticola]